MKHKKSSVRTYCRRVSARLRCSRVTRQRLLAGVRSEIAEALPEEATYSEIVAAYGTPKELCARLQETIEPAEYHRACRNRALLTVACVLLVAAAALTVALGHAVKEMNDNLGYVIVEIEVGDDILNDPEQIWPENDPNMIWP